ncbi:hypothetical protein BX070DRAFT_249384 [Coemansia spiralis]|nr:hypothetical protein BX070DRAFT_249384 [Coemansia spiralis]
MGPRGFFKIAGVPITQDVIPLSILIGSMICFGVYTGYTRLRDPNYIRMTPSHAWRGVRRRYPGSWNLLSIT